MRYLSELSSVKSNTRHDRNATQMHFSKALSSAQDTKSTQASHTPTPSLVSAPPTPHNTPNTPPPSQPVQTQDKPRPTKTMPPHYPTHPTLSPSQGGLPPVLDLNLRPFLAVAA